METDPNVEMLRWLETLELQKTVYDKPLRISDEFKERALALPAVHEPPRGEERDVASEVGSRVRIFPE